MKEIPIRNIYKIVNWHSNEAECVYIPYIANGTIQGIQQIKNTTG